jgi:citrate synthase
MTKLKEKLAAKFAAEKADIAAFVKEHASTKVSEVTLAQAYGGLRGVKGLVCDTSEVPPEKGLIIRGIELGDITHKLPEEILYLLLTGDLPNEEELKELHDELKAREEVPAYVWSVLEAMPKDSHPMAMFNTGILVMQKESVFAKKYAQGIKKADYWEPTLEDTLNLIAKLPALGAYVYRLRFDKGERIQPDANADWGKNFVHMLGLPDPNGELTELMRLYLTLHCDHEGGNVSAYSAATIASALSDLYYALSGGLNGLAGPLHGLANQECLGWVLETIEEFGGVPTEEQIEKFTWDTLNAGKVIPGYGHAVLRVTDPRYTAFLGFGRKHCMDSDVFQTVSRVYDVVPKVLSQVKKISNPWPNVDAGSGSLLYYYGMKEFSYYTVLFSISRAMGIAAQAVVARAMGYAITRPKSLPTDKFKAMLGVK